MHMLVSMYYCIYMFSYGPYGPEIKHYYYNKFNIFFGLNLTLVYTFPMCMAWRFQFPIRNYDFKTHLFKAAFSDYL